MELMDWKAIETESENQISGAMKQTEIAEILLAHAVIQIKALGGKTNQEINEKTEPNCKKPTNTA
jgi:hypothetical protein